MSKTRFVTAEEICEEFDVCSRTLYRWIELGRFPAPLRIGVRKRLWLRTEYESLIEQARQEPSTTK
jgi:predicted DNA-binding transcriptional regulator AlpA